MPLQKQLVPVQLGQGVDTKTDPRQLIPGKMVNLENVNLETTKKYKKRPGNQTITTNLQGGGTLGTNPIGLATLQNQLIQYNGTTGYTYSQDTLKWQSVGSFTPLLFSKTQVSRVTNNISNQDIAVHSSGLICYVWNGASDAGPAKYTIVDGTTNSPLPSQTGGIGTIPSLSANSIRVKVFPMGQNFVFVGMDSSTKQLFYSTVAVSSPQSTPSSAIALTTDGHATNFVWDGDASTGTLFFSYQNTSNEAATSFLTVSLVKGVTVASSGSGSKCISTFVDAVKNKIWVAMSSGTTASYNVYNPDLSSFLANTAFGGSWTAAGTVIRNITGVVSNGSANIFYESGPTTKNYDGFIAYGTANDAGTNSQSNITYGLGLISKPFLYNSNYYVFTTRKSTLQTSYYLLNSSGNIICKSSVGVAGGLNSNGSTGREVTGTLSNVYALSSTQFVTSGIEASKAVDTPVTLVTYGVVGCYFEFNAAPTTQKVMASNTLIVNGGTLMMYDGTQFVEQGFLYYPEDLTITDSGATGAYTNGAYSFQVIFEWSDAQGNIYQSTPSSIVTHTVNGGSGSSNLIVACSGLTLTQKTNVNVVLYRTPLNTTTAPLQRDQAIANSVTSPNFSTTITSTVEPPTGDNIYTTGGVVGNDSPPATKAIALYRNRVVAVPCEQGSSFWYSDSLEPGVAVNFSLSFTWNIDPRGGDIVGLIQMDDKLLLGKASTWFFMNGAGPASTGDGNDFTDAQLLPVDCGVINPKSLLLLPMGVFFKAQKGLYVLDRSLQAQYIGADVEQYNSANITSALLLQDGRTARFSTDGGVILNYNYYLNQWHFIPGPSPIDAVLFQGVYAYLNSDATVTQQVLTSFSDSGNPIKMRLQTGWLSFAGLQGYQRVYRLFILGDYISADQMVVKVAYDFNPDPVQVTTVNLTNTYAPTSTWGSSATWGSDSFWGGSTFPPMQARIDLLRQKCQSIQITIEDSQSYDSGEGFEVSGLAFEVGLERGGFRIDSGRKFG